MLTIELPNPLVPRKLAKLDSNEIKRAKEYFRRLAHFQNLSIKKPLIKGYGHAQFGSKTIWVPSIRDKIDFMTCLHEVGHSLSFYSLLSGQARSEYEADMFALRRARHFGLDNAFLVEYEKHSKLYVAAYLDVEFRVKKYKWSELSIKVQQVATWLGIAPGIWDSVTELPFSSKVQLPDKAIAEVFFRVSTECGTPKDQITGLEHERIDLEGMHSNFDLLTRDLIRVNEESILMK